MRHVSNTYCTNVVMLHMAHDVWAGAIERDELTASVPRKPSMSLNFLREAPALLFFTYCQRSPITLRSFLYEVDSPFPEQTQRNRIAILILQLVHVDFGRYWSCGFALGQHTSVPI